MNDDPNAIRDEDLLRRLEEARARGGFIQAETIALSRLQRDRDEERAAREAAAEEQARVSALDGARPRDARRRAAVRAVYENAAPTLAEVRHIHSVLAVCGLPYERAAPSVRVHERGQGRMSLRVEAGALMRPDGAWEEQPLPYGPKARLLLLHFCSEAVRTRSRTIEVGDSLSGFMRGLGFQVTGGRKGTINLFKDQINALAACSIRVGTFDGARSTTTTFAPFREVDVWMGRDLDQLNLWPSRVTFSQEFYDSLSHHALPVNGEAVRALAGSARKLDLYFWLGYRLHALKAPLHLSWKALGEQFLGGFTRERAFRAQFAEDLAAILEVLPRLPARLGPEGLGLSPCGPDALALPPRKAAPRPGSPPKPARARRSA